METFNKLMFLVGLVLFVGLLTSLPVFLLWNGCLVGAIDGIHEIGWFQAWGLTLLFNILTKFKVEHNGK
jgi:hypothetical protein